MENTALTNSLKRELAMQTENYERAIDAAIELLQGYKGRKPSDHLGHNLANRATDLSSLAGKIEQTENMIRWSEGN